jgi:hypothetical protein
MDIPRRAALQAIADKPQKAGLPHLPFSGARMPPLSVNDRDFTWRTSFKVKKDIFAANSQPTMTPVSAPRFVAMSQSPSAARGTATLPNPAGFLGGHRLALGALKCLAEPFEVPNGAIHADLSHRLRARVVSGGTDIALTRALSARQEEALALGIAIVRVIGRLASRNQGIHERPISDAQAAVVGGAFGHRETVARRRLGGASPIFPLGQTRGRGPSH